MTFVIKVGDTHYSSMVTERGLQDIRTMIEIGELPPALIDQRPLLLDGVHAAERALRCIEAAVERDARAYRIKKAHEELAAAIAADEAAKKLLEEA
jgi:hypothetical protein